MFLSFTLLQFQINLGPFEGPACLVFLTPPAHPGVPLVWLHVGQTCSVSFLAFKRVTHGSTIKTHFPSPLLFHGLVGPVGHLEQTTNKVRHCHGSVIFIRSSLFGHVNNPPLGKRRNIIVKNGYFILFLSSHEVPLLKVFSF